MSQEISDKISYVASSRPVATGAKRFGWAAILKGLRLLLQLLLCRLYFAYTRGLFGLT